MSTNEIVPASGDAVATEIVEIERSMRSGEYWQPHAEPMRQRYLELLRAREGSAQPPAAPSEVDKEIVNIEKLMRTDRREYERSGAADRYLELLRQREGDDEAPAAVEEWRATPEQARRDLSPQVVAELERSGDFAGSLRKLQDDLVDMLVSVNEGGAVNDFVAAFDGLPGTAIQTAVYLELARGAPTFAPLATDEHLAALETEIYGPALIEAWGSAAARKFGIARARWARCVSDLSATDHDALCYFFNHAQPVEQAAIIWHLAG